jgi:hypothetical protein
MFGNDLNVARRGMGVGNLRNAILKIRGKTLAVALQQTRDDDNFIFLEEMDVGDVT